MNLEIGLWINPYYERDLKFLYQPLFNWQCWLATLYVARRTIITRTALPMRYVVNYPHVVIRRPQFYIAQALRENIIVRGRSSSFIL